MYPSKINENSSLISIRGKTLPHNKTILQKNICTRKRTDLPIRFGSVQRVWISHRNSTQVGQKWEKDSYTIRKWKIEDTRSVYVKAFAIPACPYSPISYTQPDCTRSPKAISPPLTLLPPPPLACSSLLAVRIAAVLGLVREKTPRSFVSRNFFVSSFFPTRDEVRTHRKWTPVKDLALG